MYLKDANDTGIGSVKIKDSGRKMNNYFDSAPERARESAATRTASGAAVTPAGIARSRPLQPRGVVRLQPPQPRTRTNPVASATHEPVVQAESRTPAATVATAEPRTPTGGNWRPEANRRGQNNLRRQSSQAGGRGGR
ncbi:MAG: hypothetical protein LBH46_02755 [Rickettsiales bacterium]|nr:hypothetical protein [Rickettsiales bacterium]